LIVFDNNLDIKVQSTFSSDIHRACLTSSYILVSQYNSKYCISDYFIEHFDRKFLKMNKPPIEIAFPEFNATDNYLIYVHFDH
jgi:hypothetical protein